MKQSVTQALLFDSDNREKLLDELVERAKPYIRASLAQLLDQLMDQSTSQASLEHSFGLTFDEFVKLSEEEQIVWGHQVLMLKKDWLEEQIAKRKAEWILIVGGKVVRSSSSLEKLPSKREIYRIAKKQGFAPFLFIKDILIEESGVSFCARGLHKARSLQMSQVFFSHEN